MDLVQVFKVDLVHREGISAMRSRLGCTAIPKSRGQRWAQRPGQEGNAVTRGKEGLWSPWQEGNAVARGGEGAQRPWEEKKAVTGGREGAC